MSGTATTLANVPLGPNAQYIDWSSFWPGLALSILVVGVIFAAYWLLERRGGRKRRR